MNTLIQQILSILVVPPGNLIYHLVLAFCIAAGLQFSIIHSASVDQSANRRLMIGFSILLAAQFVLFVLSGLAWQGLFNADTLLPPLDRMITAFSLVWIIWLWAFPETNRPADSLAIIFSILILIGFGFTLFSWQASLSQQNFNATILGMTWEGVSLGLAICGLALLLFQHPVFTAAGLGFFILAILGHTLQLLFPALVNHYPGMVRFTQIIAYPLLLLLPQRLQGQVEPVVHLFQPRRRGVERRQYASDPNVAASLLQVAAETDPTQLPQAITHSVCQVMFADVCLLLTIDPADQQAYITGGYNLIQNHKIEAGPLAKDRIPVLFATLGHNHSLNLKANARSVDQKTLTDLYSFQKTGSLLAIPLLDAPGQPFGGLVLLSPYNERVWNKNDQTYLVLLGEAISRIWQRAHPTVPIAVTEEPPANPEPASLQADWVTDDELEAQKAKEIAKNEELSRIPPPLNIERIIDYVLSQLSHQIGEKNLSLRVDIPDDLPDLIVDQNTLQQVLYNLLENACEVTPAEENIQIKIRPHADAQDRPAILIQITDQGGGISTEEQKRFFSLAGDEEIHSIKGVSKPDEVFAAKVLVEGQGGNLWLDSDGLHVTTMNVLVVGKTLPSQDNPSQLPDRAEQGL